MGRGPPAWGGEEEEEEPPGWAAGWHPLIVCSLPSLPRLSRLRPLDIEFLQRLCRTVNVVPVIARADSLTIEEREAFRHRVIWAPGTSLGSVGVWSGGECTGGLRSSVCGPQIQENLKTHGIEVYPQKCFDEDINDKILNSKIRVGGHGRWGGWWDQGWVMCFPLILSI